MVPRAIHTVPTDIGWANRRGGTLEVLSTHPTRAEAEATGRRLAQTSKVDHVIHNKDGQIDVRNSYSNESPPA